MILRRQSQNKNARRFEWWMKHIINSLLTSTNWVPHLSSLENTVLCLLGLWLFRCTTVRNSTNFRALDRKISFSIHALPKSGAKKNIVRSKRTKMLHVFKKQIRANSVEQLKKTSCIPGIILFYRFPSWLLLVFCLKVSQCSVKNCGVGNFSWSCSYE